MTLSPIQRRAVERRIGELEDLVAPSDAKSIGREVAQLVAFYATGRTDEQAVALKIAVYVEALAGMPSWAVAEARRRWFRGELPGGDQNFQPPPAVMRAGVDGLRCVALGQASALRRLLAAEPEREFTDDERERNHARLATLFASRPTEGNADVASKALGSD